VSKALLIIGMFMPKLGLAPFFGTATLAGALGGAAAVAVLLLTWAVSVQPAPMTLDFLGAGYCEKNRSS
jgi:hypothetical protein